MLRVYRTRTITNLAALAAVPFAFAGLAASASAEDKATHEVTVTITKVKALDKADELSAGDFFARVTIDGEAKETAVVDQKSEFKPKDWKISKKVKPGKVNVKLALIDKDVAQDDPIDINKVANKRDLDFTVDTKSCKVEGFSSTYKCGSTITRAGKEQKEAEISFKVSVKK